MTGPYAHLRAAQAAGKRIEQFSEGNAWWVVKHPSEAFWRAPELYRIAPGQDDPVFEVGKVLPDGVTLEKP